MNKKVLWTTFAAVVITINGCRGGVEQSELSQSLQSKYDFYEDSVKNIKKTMAISQEDADKVFECLVSECGVDETMQYCFKGNDENTYVIWSGLSSFDVKLKGNKVETVMRGNKQIYPAIEAGKEIEQPEQDENLEKDSVTGMELISMKGHPVLYDYLSEAHAFWDDYAEGRIDFADNYFDDYKSEKTVLCIGAYLQTERNLKEHMIRDIEIYPDDKISLKDGLELAKSYIPMEMLKKWYKLDQGGCYFNQDNSDCMYYMLYKKTKKGEKDTEKQGLDIKYIVLIIETENDIVKSIAISSTFSLPNTGSDELRDWSYDFLEH